MKLKNIWRLLKGFVRKDSTFSLAFFPLPEAKTKKEKGAPIQRSTETGMAVELTRNMSRQPSRESNNGSMNSYNSEGKLVTFKKKILSRFTISALLPLYKIHFSDIVSDQT